MLISITGMKLMSIFVEILEFNLCIIIESCYLVDYLVSEWLV